MTAGSSLGGVAFQAELKDKIKPLRLKSREGNSTPLQSSCLENPTDGGAWWAAVHGVAKSRTRLSDFLFTFHFHALEKEMATYSGVLAWRIPGMGEPGGLPSIGSHRVGHNWSDLATKAARIFVYVRNKIKGNMSVYSVGFPSGLYTVTKDSRKFSKC